MAVPNSPPCNEFPWNLSLTCSWGLPIVRHCSGSSSMEPSLRLMVLSQPPPAQTYLPLYFSKLFLSIFFSVVRSVTDSIRSRCYNPRLSYNFCYHLATGTSAATNPRNQSCTGFLSVSSLHVDGCYYCSRRRYSQLQPLLWEEAKGKLFYLGDLFSGSLWH